MMMMMRTNKAIRLVPLLALAACAAEPVAVNHVEPASSPAAASAPWGKWVVTDSFPSGSGDAGAARLIGQEVVLDFALATEVGGRTCAQPIYRNGTMTEGEFLGNPARMAEFPALTRPVMVTEVYCGSALFARYGHWRDGSLLTGIGPAVLRLERVGTNQGVHIPTVSPAPEIVPVTAEPIAVVAPPHTEHASAEPAHEMANDHQKPPTAKKPTPHKERAGEMQVYLASYLGEKAAHRGWELLAAKSPALATLEPETVPVDLGAKGKFLRLFAKGADESKAKAVCRELKAILPGCGHKP